MPELDSTTTAVATHSQEISAAGAEVPSRIEALAAPWASLGASAVAIDRPPQQGARVFVNDRNGIDRDRCLYATRRTDRERSLPIFTRGAPTVGHAQDAELPHDPGLLSSDADLASF
ncbi:hypothetical protein [Microbacterium sp. CH12i]|uniref:hypothetical protein n=1 Tax=Microbacterium sp. CH12i TaxID=1479651 RepID=UPI00055B8969|nr:hypothetical protein [Microbacterium sp. CH12i]